MRKKEEKKVKGFFTSSALGLMRRVNQFKLMKIIKTKAVKKEVKEAPKTKEVKTEAKTEVFTQNGKPYKKVTWINGVPTIEWL